MTDVAYSRYERQSGTGRSGSDRTEQRRDRDRLLYSPYLRRLSGITQIISPLGYHLTHNRLTHTLEVAQIARSIAERLLPDANQDPEAVQSWGGLDPDVVEAAALAHDIGHPPFGHIAERELNDLVSEGSREPDGYEGNAQTFRILTKLDVRFDETRGLDLTRATLSAASKYPWFREEAGEKNEKWGAYYSERDEFEWSRIHLPDSRKAQQTLEAEIMDWADDIAYAVHDLEDFYRAGLVPLDRLATDEVERTRFLAAAYPHGHDEEARVLAVLLGTAPIDGAFDGSHKSRARLKELSSNLVDRYITSTTLAESGADTGLNVPDDRRSEVRLLKNITRLFVINSDAVRSQRHGQRSIIRRLYEELLEDATRQSKGSRLLPLFYRELIDADRSASNMIRCVSDFISSLTEPQVVAFHNRITGTSLGTDLDQVVY